MFDFTWLNLKLVFISSKTMSKNYFKNDNDFNCSNNFQTYVIYYHEIMVDDFGFDIFPLLENTFLLYIIES